MNKLILIGNGFDLAHGLKTTYRDFINWTFCDAFEKYCTSRHYSDCLMEIKHRDVGMWMGFDAKPTTFEHVINLIFSSNEQSLKYHSQFFERLVKGFGDKKWVDIEQYYFRTLKKYFSNIHLSDKAVSVNKLNTQFEFLIVKLGQYIQSVNKHLSHTSMLWREHSNHSLKEAFEPSHGIIKFLNFNYTDTLYTLHYANVDDIIHIHGQISDITRNPIIFGYGDETDPVYQQIEDSGKNIYLEHIKSFAYFQTNNYQKLLSFIDANSYEVSIVGHSCGLSDRVLLNEIFEHPNCNKINIFYHQRSDGSDNFKEITLEISRHFKPHNKNMMRRKVGDKNRNNVIPQNV